MNSRRQMLKQTLLGGAALGVPAAAVARAAPPYRRGHDGQRVADLGDGRYLNPIFAGDHPDPSILKDGADYYMTFTSFEATPALVVWHSRDLVNWQPLGPALAHPPGSVFAVDLVKHQGRYYLYIPIIPTAISQGLGQQPGIYVIHAERIEGPWSEPVSLNIAGHIDPGHIVGEDGKRYLFLSGVSRVQLSDDGLSTSGPIEHVYDGWRYPDDWVTEAYALEGPKLIRRGDWFYMVSAVGGTAGPPTGHMVIAARSRSVNGPWENCPHNPIVRTRDASEKWWSRGHATLVEGPAGDWWMVYHGYENGYWTLGRQTLLEPVEWTSDGWFKARGGDLSQPLPKPRGGQAQAHGIALSDDFSQNLLGLKWNLYDPGLNELRRVRYEPAALVLQGKGSTPSDCSPLTCLVGDHAYEFSVELELIGDVQGGLLLFYSRALYVGMGHNGTRMSSYRFGQASPYWKEPAPAVRRLHLKIVNDRHIVTMYYSEDGRQWKRHGLRAETSGYNTNTGGELLSLRPALFATGSGSVRFRNFHYQARG
ncbi:family 43 glycosylhydrolase [Duganella sp. FT50W]|uniref:Family 43 glycosylhydrolase n=1 Tax=Duganella lactea TaxID=2692173 RepID=A0A6L8MKI1_9BURK|nr:family 43 glycosylhydrolase [Duganella lactea]MYM83383.1 family 43 glycosylhydrolase [Duganella lactea]